MLSRKAILLQGALSAALLPRIAQDHKLPDFSKVLAKVTAKNFAGSKGKLALDIGALLKGKMAQDAKLDDLPALLDAFEKIEGGEGPEPVDAGGAETDGAGDPPPFAETEDAGGSPADAIKGLLAGKVDEATMAQLDEILAKIGATSAPPAQDGEESEEDRRKREAEEKAKQEKDKQAMDRKLTIAVDSAVKAAVAKARTEERANQSEIRVAFDKVRPIVGDLQIAADSAADVYKAVLEAHDIAVDGVHPSAYETMVGMIGRPGAPRVEIAADRALANDVSKMFPNDNRLL